MNVKSYIATWILCASPLLCQAGVIYEWAATNDKTPIGITLQLEFDSETVKSGEFKLDLEYDYAAGFGKVPKNGLLALRYWFPGMANIMNYSSMDRRGFDFGRGYLNVDVKFREDGFLAGSIYANDTNSHIFMASVEEMFTILDANSDEGMPGAGCGFQDNIPCVGATGHIQRVRKIPEPASIALLAIGAASIARTRRRKSAK